MSRSRVIVPAALLIGVTLLAYLPALHGGFIFDDDVFLTDNPLIRAGDGLRRFWFGREAADYWPVASTTLWIEWRLWGLNAAGYHATNVALHVAEVVLLWATLHRLRVPGALVGALLFAVHPVNAESVTWITERKNLMAMLFFLLTIFWFAEWLKVERVDPDAQERGRGTANALRPASSMGGDRHYWLSLASLVLAMLSKGSAVVLPLVLLGLVAWRRRPNARDALRLAPFFLVAAALAFIESGFSTVLAPADMQPLGLLERLLRAAGIVWFYLGKALWPVNLCFDYGPWTIHSDNVRWWAPLIAACAMTALLWIYRRGWSRPALFGWGYFCVALLPVLGFAEVGFMRYSPVSDHYAHLAMIGVCALAGAGWAWLAGNFSRRWLAAVAATMLAGFGVQTWQQNRIYSDAVTLYRDTLARNPASALSLTNLGALLSEAGQNDEAVELLERAVRLKPDSPESRNDLGVALYRSGRVPEAVAQYEEALRVRPDLYRVHNNLGVVLARSGRLPEAMAHFEEALRIEPDFREAQQNLAHARQLSLPR